MCIVLYIVCALIKHLKTWLGTMVRSFEELALTQRQQAREINLPPILRVVLLPARVILRGINIYPWKDDPQ